jgi:hypothetical protein
MTGQHGNGNNTPAWKKWVILIIALACIAPVIYKILITKH